MTVCRKRGKKIACRRATPRVLDTPCPPFTFLPFAPPNAVYLLGERTRQRDTASHKKKGMPMKGIENPKRERGREKKRNGREKRIEKGVETPVSRATD